MDDGAQLRFRPLDAVDLDAIVRLHSDPETNLHNPDGPDADVLASRRRLDEWLRHWVQHGYGYELALEDEQCVGICGVRRDRWQQHQVLNLYWRLLPEHWGRGLSAVLGEHALSTARRVRAGDELVVARMLPGNIRSRRVAERLRMRRRFDLDGSADGAQHIVYADAPCSSL